MDPLTHLLTGAALSRAGLNRKTALATATLVLAAEFPDIDIVMNFFGPVTGFAHHRGFTHTLLGLLFNAAVVLLVVWLWESFVLRRKRAEDALQPRWKLLYIYGLIAGTSHILLDFTNNYGVRPFAPFYPRWYEWDIVFIVEPVILIALVLALLMPWFGGFIGSEIGARRPKFHGRKSAIAALIFMVIVWGVRDHYHRRALALLNDNTYGVAGESPIRVAAGPYPVSPFEWHGIVETNNNFYTVELNMLRDQFEADAVVYPKPAETPAILAAKKSYLGRVYLDWARFPYVTTQLFPESGETEVFFSDLRFQYPGWTWLGRTMNRESQNATRRPPLGASVLLDRNLHVEEMRMGNNEQKPGD